MAIIGLQKGSGKRSRVREKSVKSQRILIWIMSGNPDSLNCTVFLFVSNKEGVFNLLYTNNPARISQKAPLCGISCALSIVLIWSIVFRSGDKPPCTHNTHSSMI